MDIVRGEVGSQANLADLSRALLQLSALDAPRMEFLGLVSEALMDFSQADAVDVCLHERNRYFCVGAVRKQGATQVAWDCCNADDGVPCRALGDGGLACVRPAMHSGPTQVVQGTPSSVRLAPENEAGQPTDSSVLSPFLVGAASDGLVLLRTCRREWFSAEQAELYASLSGLLGVAIEHQAAQRKLLVRGRELATLYQIARLVSAPDASIPETLDRIAQAVPGGCPEPARVSVRIVVDGETHGAEVAPAGASSVSRPILAHGAERGVIELALAEGVARAADDELLASMSRLLGGVARQVENLLCRAQLRAEIEGSERHLRHADRLATVGTLASGLGHELVEPLTAIVGFAELLHKDPSLSEQAQRDLDRIESASNHAREIVRRLMLLARQSPSGWQEVAPNQVVEDALSFVEQRCKATNVRIVRELDAAAPSIVGDRTQICQVVVNLLRNAIQAMPNGGELCVRTRALPDGLSISVEDCGVGMSDETRSRMFEPFFTTRTARGGMGLGMAVVHDIVGLHGGNIDVQSALGEGTRIDVRLPLEPPSRAAKQAEGNGGRGG